MASEGNLLGDSASFDQLGIDRRTARSWEDGLRLPQPFVAGSWEWWYCDAHFSNGYFCVASHHIEIDSNGINHPFISLNIAKDGKKLCDLRIPVDADSASFSQDHCDTKLGKHFFRSIDGGMDRYHVYVDPTEARGFGVDLILERTVPSYRPGTGRWDVDGCHFSWFCAVPGANAKGQLFVDGETVEVQGNGYHDHNWGNVPMDRILSDWLWSRAEVEGTTVVSASVRFRQDVGGRETPLLYVARGDDILVDAFNDDVVCLEGVKIPQPDTGKHVSSDCIYLVERGDLSASVRFDGQHTVIASFQWANSSSNWETWYTRFPAKVTVDIRQSDGPAVRTTGSGTLENMDFFGRPTTIKQHERG
ncbi:hypothetical protein RN629_15675 [Sphingomonadaceae bacterium jetA1]|uniref:hypothetical protein n=1 Tax=Facivitalis istanbulensis TaxID=3075838 RepID=UPI0034756AFA